MAHACENCKFRAHYDAKPNSALGRFLEMAQETFLNLINQSMQESARLVRSSLGRSSYATTREKALEQVAMLQAAKDQATGK